MTDAKGARLSESPFSYAATISVLNGIVMALFQSLRGNDLRAMASRHWPILTFGAALSVASYTIYVWALMRAPVGLVAALRETSCCSPWRSPPSSCASAWGCGAGPRSR